MDTAFNKPPRGPAPDASEERIGQVLNDFLDRRARGEPVSKAQLLAQHPDLADELCAHLDLLRDLRPGGGRIEDLINQGILTHPTTPQYVAEFGDYRILGLIGRGGMGIVLKAYEESLGRTVALKLLRPELGEDSVMLARFEREAKAAAGLRHPNIVTIFAVGQQRGVPFIAMEYVNGFSLAEVIRASGRQAAEFARRVLHELLAGLDAAHKAGLIHRDIKPSNILLDLGWSQGRRDEGAPRQWEHAAPSPPATDAHPSRLQSSAPSPLPFVKIADFGLARMNAIHTQLTLTESALGTPAYMSPEQARGAKDIDHRTDLYSAGVVLYEMLTGQSPFGADTSAVMIHRILHECPSGGQDLLNGVDPTLASLALRLMAKRPEDRFASAEQARAALDAGQEVSSPERRRLRWRYMRRAAALIVGVAALVAGGALLTTRSHSDAARMGPLREVRVSPDAPRIILGRYDNDTSWRVFRDEFPSEVTRIDAVQLVHAEATGRPAVVAGLGILHAATNLVAYDARTGAQIWGTDLSEPWPGSEPGEPWRITFVEVGDLGAGRGEQLLVVSTLSKSFPSRLSIVDPKTGAVRASFWHMGHVSQPRIAPDFLGPGRPAIVATCLSNKLDEFPVIAGESPRTSFDIVSALVVLDPNTMDGLSPPLMTEVPDLPRARPYAYAFLNMPPSALGTYVPPGGTQRVQPSEGMCADITEVLIPSQVPSAPTAPHLVVGIGRRSPGGVTLTLSQDLDVLHTSISSGETEGTSTTYWRDRWIPVFQHGDAVAARAAAADQQAGPDADRAGEVVGITPPAPISAVWADPHKRNVILARRGNDNPPVVFHEFAADVSLVMAVVLVDPDGHGPSMVVAGLSRSLEGHAIYAFDLAGRELWRLDLSSDRQWPDCAPPTKWNCTFLLAANLDGEPGDELVAVVRDCLEYGTRLSVIDPRTQAVRSTFWNFGAILHVTLVPDFFGLGHPALAAVGVNNKLDGFAEALPGDDARRTGYDMVSVAMVLDPRDMEGIGPPRSRRLPDLPVARPYAYAFLDRPPWPGTRYTSVADGPPVSAQSDEIVAISEINLAPYIASDDSGPWLLAYFVKYTDLTSPGYLIVDRILEPRQFVVPNGASTATEFERRREFWHPIIQNGRYVGE